MTQNLPSPLVYGAAAVLMLGGFFLFGGSGENGLEQAVLSEQGGQTVASNSMSLQEATGLSDADIARISSKGRDVKAEPWLVAPSHEEVKALLERSARLEVAWVKSIAFSAPQTPPGAVRNPRHRKIAVDFTKPGSMKVYRVKTQIEWTPGGWKLLS